MRAPRTLHTAWILAVLGLAGCGRLHFDWLTPSNDGDDATVEAGMDAATPDAAAEAGMDAAATDAATPAMDAALADAAAADGGIDAGFTEVPNACRPADLARSAVVTFNTTVSGAGVASDTINFPVLVRIDDPAIIASVQLGAPDLRFTDTDCAPLSYEVERWDQTAGRAEVWVLVPQIDGDSATDSITMHYDDDVNGDVADAQDASAVFSNANGFVAVWHMNQAPTDGVRDSSQSANDLTHVSMEADDLGDSLIGQGIQFDAAGDEYLTRAEVSQLNGASFSLSAWMKRDVDQDGAFFAQGETQAALQSLHFTYRLGNTIRFAFYSCDTDSLGSVGADTTSYMHVVGTYSQSDSTQRLYVDGALNNSRTCGSLNTTGRLTVGSWRGLSRFFNGRMDEVRIESTSRSADWVKLCYETQRAGQTAVAVTP